MQHHDTPTDRLVTDLEAVCNHVTMTRCGGVWQLTAFVGMEYLHAADRVNYLYDGTPSPVMKTEAAELSAAIGELLDRLTAPQAVSA